MEIVTGVPRVCAADTLQDIQLEPGEANVLVELILEELENLHSKRTVRNMCAKVGDKATLVEQRICRLVEIVCHAKLCRQHRTRLVVVEEPSHQRK